MAKKGKQFGIITLLAAQLVITITFLMIVDRSPEVKNTSAKVEQLQFPSAHNVHPSYQSEWWYLNLTTRSQSGDVEKDLGHVISFSRISGKYGLLSSRFEEGVDSFSENTDIGGELTVELVSDKFLLIRYSNKSANMVLRQEENDKRVRYFLTGSTPEVGNFNLTLEDLNYSTSKKVKPLLWNGNGNISVFALNDTFYYSIPNLDVRGTITDVDGKIRNVVSGKTWFDHQWFNSTPPPDWDGHFWSSIHFSENPDPYVTENHQALGFVTQIYSGKPKYTYWVLRDEFGKNHYGNSGSFFVKENYSNGYPKSFYAYLYDDSGAQKVYFSGISLSSNQIFSPPIGPDFYEPATYYRLTKNGDSSLWYVGVGFFETHLQWF